MCQPPKSVFPRRYGMCRWRPGMCRRRYGMCRRRFGMCRRRFGMCRQRFGTCFFPTLTWFFSTPTWLRATPTWFLIKKQGLFPPGNPCFASKPLPNRKTVVFLAKTGLLWSKNDTLLRPYPEPRRPSHRRNHHSPRACPPPRACRILSPADSECRRGSFSGCAPRRSADRQHLQL
jgi:hypothetical protein